MATPPNVDNLSLFKGIIKWMANGEASYRDLGEVSAFTTSMDAETLNYLSRRHSSRIPVKTITLGRTMTVAFTMSEPAPENVLMWLAGETSGSPPGAVMSIGTASEVRGALRYIGTNEVGVPYQVDLYDVIINPTGDLAWLTDNDWSELQMQGTVMANTTTGSFGDVQEITAGVEVPMTGSPPV